MTEEEATALGKRLLACKGFRPMRGMLDMQGRTWDASLLWRWNSAVDVPDLRDPATLGCVLALVREAWGDLHMVARCDDRHGKVSWWICRWGDLPRSRECSTEAEALVAALEAAP